MRQEDLDLNGVQRTMYITMLARARETQRTGALVTDLKAVEMQSKIKDIFPVEKGDWKSETGVIVRTTILDEYIQNYINQHPNACCINLGCGLDTRFYRLNQHDITWYNVDLPGAIEVRKKLLGEDPAVTTIAGSILETKWMEAIHEDDRPVLIIMEGLLMYFDESDVKRIMSMLYERFPKAILVVEILSDKVAGKTKMTKSIEKTGSTFKWGLHSGTLLPVINPHICFIKEMNLVDRMYLKNGIYKLLSKINAIRNLSNRIVMAEFK